jgi:hypothetical protein
LCGSAPTNKETDAKYLKRVCTPTDSSVSGKIVARDKDDRDKSVADDNRSKMR